MDLYYKSLGEGQPILLLHGLFGAAENLGMVARPLTEQYQVISVDLRNHGRSPHSSAMDYPVMAMDVLRLIEHLGLANCTILGHSMGGKVAMQLALHQPDVVNALIVADIAPISYPLHHEVILAALQRLAATRISSRNQADQILAETISDTGTRQFLLTNLKRQEDKSLALRLNLEAIIANQEIVCRAIDGQPFKGPSLFISGNNSDYVTDRAIEPINRLFPANQQVVIENAGHWLHAEQTAAFNAAVNAFLRETQD